MKSALPPWVRKYRLLLIAGILLVNALVFVGVARVIMKGKGRGGEAGAYPEQKPAAPEAMAATIAPGREAGEQEQQRRKVEEERVKQAIERSQRSALEQLEAKKREPTEPTYIRDTGRIHPETATRLGLSEQEVAGLKAVLERVKQQRAEDFKQRTRMERTEEKEDGTHYHLYTRARRDRGQELQDAIANGLGKVVGGERLEKLAKSANNFATEYARADVESEMIVGKDGKVVVAYTFWTPDTGKKMMYGSQQLGTEETTIGDFYEVPGATK